MISVLICTYNRRDTLKLCLTALEALSVPIGLDWEVVIVDNDSNDGTREEVAEFQKRQRVPAVYVFEDRRGKSYALNRAIRCSSGDVLAFIDDDCLVDNSWLGFLSREFQDSAISGIGGRVELYDSKDRPVTVRTNQKRIALKSVFEFSLVPGCNMAFRRNVFELVGLFDERFGPGTRLVSEDTDFVYRVLRRGLRIVYSPDLLVYHNHGRRTDEQVRILNESYVRGRGAFYCKHILMGDGTVAKMAYWEIRSLIKDALKNMLDGKAIKEESTLLGDLCSGAACQIRNTLKKLFSVGTPTSESVH
jgi:glycosyltransferase involved in cell wall biosynthesis